MQINQASIEDLNSKGNFICDLILYKIYKKGGKCSTTGLKPELYSYGVSHANIKATVLQLEKDGYVTIDNQYKEEFFSNQNIVTITRDYDEIANIYMKKVMQFNDYNKILLAVCYMRGSFYDSDVEDFEWLRMNVKIVGQHIYKMSYMADFVSLIDITDSYQMISTKKGLSKLVKFLENGGYKEEIQQAIPAINLFTEGLGAPKTINNFHIESLHSGIGDIKNEKNITVKGDYIKAKKVTKEAEDGGNKWNKANKLAVISIAVAVLIFILQMTCGSK